MLPPTRDQHIPMKRSLPGRPTSYLVPQRRPSPPHLKPLNQSMQGIGDKSRDRIRQGSEGHESSKHEIFFNRTKKYNYMKEIIDKYFQQTKGTKFYQRSSNPEDMRTKQYSTVIPRIGKSVPQPDEKQNKLSARRKLRARKEPERSEELETSELIEGRLAFKDENSLQMGSNSMTKSISVGSTAVNSSSLPPIDQLFEDKDDEYGSITAYESLSQMTESRMEPGKEQKVQLFDNQIYSVDMIMVKGRPRHRLKYYKQKGQEILNRQKRAIRLDLASIWQEYRYDSNALISAPVRPIKDLLFKAKRVDLDAKYYTLKTKPYQKKLVTSNCQELVRVVRELCEFMKKWEGKVLNNKVNTSNLFIAKNQNLRLGEWGFASFKETHMIQNVEFHNRIQPIIKSQKQWFVPPEHLAPQIIRAVVFNQDQDLMAQGAASDIWSLGVAILEILTVVPVWITQKCTVYGRNMLPRSGILSVGERDLRKLLRKEQKLPQTARRLLQEQLGEEQISQPLASIMLQCLQYEPERRPTYQQIIDALK